MARSQDYCLNSQKAGPDIKNPEPVRRASVDTPDQEGLGARTDDDANASNLRISPSRQWYWFGLAVVALAFVVETALTWRRWSNITGDLGLDLYVPWRLSQGAVLFRDVFIFAGGPFSQNFDALLFKIFGGSFLTLAISNLTAIAILLLVLFRRFGAAADTWTAVTICLGVTVAFAFGYYFYEGFNYVMPYSNEALHGLILSVITVSFLADWLATRDFRWAILAGFGSGLVFLTKPDIFLALAAADIAALCLLFFLFRQTGYAIKSAGAFLIAAILPPLFFLFHFLQAENWHDGLRSVVFGWVPMFTANVVKNPFYQSCIGLDRPYYHLRNTLIQFAGIAALAVFYAVAFRLIKFERRDWTGVQQRAVPAFVPILLMLIYAGHWHQSGEAFSSSFVSMLACLWVLLVIGIFVLSTAASRWIPNLYRAPWAIVLMLIAPLFTAACGADWVDCGYSLPLVALVSCILIYWNRRTLAEQQKFVFPFLWNVFGLVLLSKLGLFSRIWGYGFVLAMPAFVAGIYCLFWLLPVLLETKWQVPPRYFRTTVWAVLMAGFWSLHHLSARNYAMQNIAVGSGPNRMLASEPLEHAETFNAALDWIERNVPRHATMAVLPQGAEINFLTRRINPTPCVAWDPNYVTLFGESRMTATYEKSPPDYIVIVERRVKLIDSAYFGTPGYGGDLMQWIGQNYQSQIIFGHEPLKNGLFGIKIMKYSREPSITGTEVSAAIHP